MLFRVEQEFTGCALQVITTQKAAIATINNR
jgi:hypothetical protein